MRMVFRATMKPMSYNPALRPVDQANAIRACPVLMVSFTAASFTAA
jgi:hypothetical protein